MHFALVIPELHKQGGTERCMASLAEALERRGHDFTIFANRRDPGVLKSAKWHRVPMLKRPHIPRFFSFLSNQALARWVANVRGERFDAVFCTGPDVLRPTVTIFHCSAAGFAELASHASQERSGSAISRLKRWNSRLSYRAIATLERRVVRNGAQTAVAISQTLRSEFQRHHGEDAGRLKILPDGVDLREFTPKGADVRERVRRELCIPREARVVLFVGHNWLRKGLPTLIEAVNRVRDDNAVLVVAGAGESTLRSDAERTLGNRVRFLGTRSDMADLYASSDVLALPTIHEPFGLPVLEAMACALPVIVSRNAGVAELITDGSDGVLLDDPSDAGELAAAITHLLADLHTRELMGAAARKTAEQFSWDALAARFESMCDEIVPGSCR
jgi:UDP-glucose:(heptosyl)LPS alpha-1,3-glucosyltransferase